MWRSFPTRLLLRLLLVACAFPVPGSAAPYVLTCTAACVVPDGTTQPAGTSYGPFEWDGTTPWSTLNTTPTLYSSQTLYQTPAPAAAAPTTIGAYAFINRFTEAEQVTLIAANPLWAVKIAAAGIIDVTSSDLITQLQAAVAAGALTSARMAQVINLEEASP